MAQIISIDCESIAPLNAGWQLCFSAPSQWALPGDIAGDAQLLDAVVPGTAALALQNAGLWNAEAPAPLQDRDFWYRTTLQGEGARALRLGGLATLAEVYLDGVLLLTSDNMFLAHEIALELSGVHHLDICFRALEPALAKPGKRARWRPRLVDHQGLRFIRTTLLGHLPGFCPPIQAVGPWRGIELVTPGPLGTVEADLRADLVDDAGELHVSLHIENDAKLSGEIECAGVRAPLIREADGRWSAHLTRPGILPWWPHTHGTPTLHAVTARINGHVIALGKTGFRRIAIDRDADGKGFGLTINDVPVFARGACWTNADLVGLASNRETCEPMLSLLRQAGMNMVRIGGTMVYEGDAFYQLCDELGLMVWQDFMFSNFDYPAADEAFQRSADAEARQFLLRTQGRPCLTVLCGGSEVAQQAAMLGVKREHWSNSLFDVLLPTAVAELRADVPYVPNTPMGGDLPFVPNEGLSHYYGVSAYMRPLGDARLAAPRFAPECLCFANVPDVAPFTLEADAPKIVHPDFAPRMDRDMGAQWYFEEVRNYYLEALYGVDAAALRRDDPAKLLDLARATSAEVMAHVFADWRREGSPTRGGIVWFGQDLLPGAGWGIVDSTGAPKAAYHGLKRILQPIQILAIDEGLNGVQLDVINETSQPLKAKIILTCLRDGRTQVMSAERAADVAAHGSLRVSAVDMIGSFFDTNYAYRFGEPSHDVVIASLYSEDGALLSQAFQFPLGRGNSCNQLDLSAHVEKHGDRFELVIATEAFAQSVHIVDPDFRAQDNWFHLPPGPKRRIALLPMSGNGVPTGTIAAVNGERICYSYNP